MGPGHAPADSGPTLRRLLPNPRIEPPPAATVSMRSIGALTRTAAITASVVRSSSPA